MIDSPTRVAAKIALNLVAQNRWCITGTPVHKVSFFF
jgi:SNF2 family DNA or RNA helicase